MKTLIVLTMLLFISCNGRKDETDNDNPIDSAMKNTFKSYDSVTESNASDNSSKQEKTKLIDSLRYNDYKFELYRIENPADDEFIDTKSILHGYKADKQIIDLNEDLYFLEIPVKAKDINGNNIPDLVVENFSGGAHCCYEFWIYELGKDFSKLLELSGDAEPKLVDLDNDGIYEIKHSTSLFAYWHACYACSFLPEYILSYKNGHYSLAKELMKKKAPDDKELELIASKIKFTNKPWDSEDTGSFEAPELFSEMLKLIFTGNMNTTWKFLDLAWPRTKPGKMQFKKDFLKQLSTFQYWNDLKNLSSN